MKINRLVLIVFALCILVIAGCASINPISTEYENHFRSIKASQKDRIKSSSIKRTFNKGYDEVWDSALYLLVQHAIVLESSKEAGTISYLSIDSLSFRNVFPENQLYYWEFPFTLLIVKEAYGTTVFVYPMTDLYDDNNKNKKWWRVIDAGFKQNGNEFVDRLSTQLSVKERWQWLRN